MQYSLLPGTNQLVNNYPGHGSSLFNQYGYQIDHPRWRDYYNMLRGNQGLQFADTLAQLLTKIWPSGPHATGTPATTPAVTQAAAAWAPPIGNVPGSLTYNPASFFNVDKLMQKNFGTPLPATSSYWGNGTWPGGPDPITRLNAYHALLRYAEHKDMLDQNPRYYLTNNFLLPGQAFEIAENEGISGLGEPQADLPKAHDNFLMAHKKALIIAALAIAAIVLYFKMHK